MKFRKKNQNIVQCPFKLPAIRLVPSDELLHEILTESVLTKRSFLFPKAVFCCVNLKVKAASVIIAALPSSVADYLQIPTA